MEILYILFFIWLTPRVLLDWDCIKEERRRKRYPCKMLSPNPSMYAYSIDYGAYVDYFNGKGKVHRLDGPARVFKDGNPGMYCLDGGIVSKEKFNLQYLQLYKVA